MRNFLHRTLLSSLILALVACGRTGFDPLLDGLSGADGESWKASATPDPADPSVPSAAPDQQLDSPSVPEVPVPEVPAAPPACGSQPQLYWVEQGAIKRAHRDGSCLETLLGTDVEHPDSLVLDVDGNRMFWTDDGNSTIRVADLDGGNPEILVGSWFVTEPLGLALDKERGDLYFADHAGQEIHWVSLADPDTLWSYTCFGASDDQVTAMAFDPATRLMYFLEGSQSVLHAYNTDTLYRWLNLRTGLDAPAGLALDAAAGKLYYSESNKLSRCNLDGTSPEVLVTSSARPNGIALDLAAGKIYWTDSAAAKLRRANLDGSGVEDVLATGPNPQGLALR